MNKCGFAVLQNVRQEQRQRMYYLRYFSLARLNKIRLLQRSKKQISRHVLQIYRKKHLIKMISNKFRLSMKRLIAKQFRHSYHW